MHQRTASEHTSKSYANDLGQFLLPAGVKKILLTSESTASSFQIEWKETQNEIPAGSDGIVHLIRQAQELWAPLAPASRNRKAAAVRGFLKWSFNEQHIPEDLSLRLVSCK